MAEKKPVFLTPESLAERLELNEKTLCTWRSLGEGPTCIRIGGRVRYPISAVEEYEASLLPVDAA